MGAASAPLEALQAQSLTSRQAMIDAARELGAAPMLRIDAVRALQQRWQAEAQRVPMDRRQEQKLWDAFRKPIDEAFNRKTQERERSEAALGERDRVVLDAARALDAANAGGDAQAIRSAMSTLDAALRGQAQAQAAVQALAVPVPEVAAQATSAEPSADGDVEAPAEPQPEAAEKPAAKPLVKPVVAVRGDDRPGMKKTEPVMPGRGGKFGDRKDGPRFGNSDGPRGPRDDRMGSRGPDRRPPHEAPPGAWQDAPRLGDTAFRAQRDALDRAQLALRKLAAQAHGEALTQLLAAWEQRSVAQLPSAQDLGARVNAATRNAWVQALGQPPLADAQQALLRLEMAAELPTPAEHLDARRAMQLHLLTRRNDAPPSQTWGQDVGRALSAAFDAGSARRLQQVLKIMLRN